MRLSRSITRVASPAMHMPRVTPEFRLEGWHTNAAFVQAQYTPLLAFCARMAQQQSER